MSDQKSNRQAPQTDDKVEVIAGVMLFDDDAPEVKPASPKQKGKPAAPGNPTVLATMDALLSTKVSGQFKRAKYDGTNATVRSDLKRTVNMWIKAKAADGVVVKVSYDTIAGTISPKASDNDEKVSVAYRISELTLPETKATDETTSDESKATDQAGELVSA